jgi:hypothetical protein
MERRFGERGVKSGVAAEADLASKPPSSVDFGTFLPSR